MPSLETARRIASTKNNGAKTIGQIYKEQSDFLMEATWDNGITSKVAYIYDYWHDDYYIDEYGIKRSLAEGMTYENTNKTRIDIKFIIKSYQSIDKDQVDYYLMFKPSQPVRFSEGDDLYYYEIDFKKRYGASFPIGLYIDIPDDKGVYHKWLICDNEPANQFPKYLILPINYELMWVEKTQNQRIKRRMWSVLRNQLSYTSGVYTDRVFGHTDNQNKVYLPINSITDKLWYTDDDSKNMRVIVSALTVNPTVWKITKCVTISPIGLQELTLYTNFFNDHTDYVNLETGEMYADYFDSEIAPTDPSTPTPTPSPSTNILATITSSSSSIKVAGSYKTVTINFYNKSNEDVTSEFENTQFNWHFNIEGTEYFDVICNDISFNKLKIKLPDDMDLIGSILTITCTVFRDDIGYVHSNELQMSITE